jgi:FHS family L-fucose permease-like MFS transporter
MTETENGGRRGRAAIGMIVLVVSLFFAWGLLTVLNDTLIPKLKALFALSYAEVMLTQFAFFLSYFILSLPAAALLARVGYLRSIVVGLVVTAAGGLMFAPAAYLGVYGIFLAALFVMGGGITMLQVAANPLIANLGDEQSSSSRLTLAQAFNSLATAVGPSVGASLILSGLRVSPDPNSTPPDVLAAFRRTEAHVIQAPYIVIAVVLVVIALIFWAARNSPTAPPTEKPRPGRSPLAVLRDHRLLAFGTLSIFIYVGCEVSIGSFMTNYLMQPSILNYAPADAGRLVSFYWGGAMVGRFVGSFALRRFPPGLVLACNAVAASVLVVVSSFSGGWFSAGAIIAVGLANSVMFPTIFALAIQGLGEDTSEGSGLLCMAIVGGAVIPPVTGLLADHVGIATALLLPAVLYLWIAAYGLLARRRAETEGVLSHV